MVVAVAISGGACTSQPQYIYVTGGSGAAGNGTAGNGAAMQSDAQKAIGAGGSAGVNKSASGSATQSGAAGSGSGSSSTAGAAAQASSGGAGQGAATTSTISACKDKAGMNACDGNRLYHCLDAGGQEPLGTCSNAMRCTAGITSGQCGTCDPGEFDCQAELLMMCDDTGTWAMSMQCASAELCSKQNHSCDPMACAKDAFNCMGDDLQQCSQDLTTFEPVMTCDAGLCDQKDGKCFECMPNTKSCDGSSLVTCDASGKKAESACTGDTRYCLKDSCVQCMSDTDCMSTSECLPAKCDTSTGMCTVGTPKAAETPCSTGGGTVCDLTGNCVVCLTDDDCHNSQLRCLTGIQCVNKNAIEATPFLTGYSVSVTPGYTVKVSGTAGVSYSMVLNDNTIPNRPATQTFTVTAANTTSTLCGITNALQLAGDVVVLTFGDDGPDSNGLPGAPCSQNIVMETLSATPAK